MIGALPFFTGDKAPEVKPIDWQVEGFLAKSAGTILFGQPGVSKTAHTAVLVAHLCQGLDFVGMMVPNRQRVFYVDLDGGWAWSGPLFKAAFRGVGIEGLPESFAYWSPLDSDLETDALDISLEFIAPALLESVRQHQADLVVIDSLGQFIAGDSDKGQDVSIALRTGLNPIRALGAAVLVIDHATKAARIAGEIVPTPAGSQQKRAWARVTVALEEVEHEGNRSTRWTVDKSNTKHFDPFLTRLTFENDSGGQLCTLTVERIGEAPPRGQKPEGRAHEVAAGLVMARLRQAPTRWGDLLQLPGIDGKKSTLSRALDFLINANMIAKGELGYYQMSLEFQSSNPLSAGTLEPSTEKASETGFTAVSKDVESDTPLELSVPSEFQASSKVGTRDKKEVSSEFQARARLLELTRIHAKTPEEQNHWSMIANQGEFWRVEGLVKRLEARNQTTKGGV